jgi:hypothetical protein
MSSRQLKPVFWGAGILLGVWLLAWTGFVVTESLKPTAERVRAYMASVDLSKLTGEDRKRALRKLADRMNALPAEERRKARLDRLWNSWFAQMTEAEKAEFIDATMPEGFKQMIGSFEQMPEEQRRKVIADSIRRMRETREKMERGELDMAQADAGTNGLPRQELSEDLQKKVVTTGLNTFYSQSSAQTKAELAPLLEEMQRSMESGAAFRRMRQGGGRP